MKKWILVSLLCFFSCFMTSGFAKPNSNTIEAKTVIEEWFASMKNGDVNKAGSFLAPEFVSIHTDGKVRNKKQEIELMKNLDMKNYQLTDFKQTQSGDAIVITYKDQGTETIDNANIGSKPAGRMAVLQKQGDQWLILAYANLDNIQQR